MEAATSSGGAVQTAEVVNRPVTEPYVPHDVTLPELTLRAAVIGIILSMVMGAANAYLGLRAGLTISTSIPVAGMTVAAFHALRKLGVSANILEANISQTVGSSSSSVASGVIFTLPALFLWGLSPGLLQMTLLANGKRPLLPEKWLLGHVAW